MYTCIETGSKNHELTSLLHPPRISQIKRLQLQLWQLHQKFTNLQETFTYNIHN